MFSKKNIRLLVILVLLSLITIWIGIQDNGKVGRGGLNVTLAVQDTSLVNRVVMVGPDFQNEFIKKGNQWILNGKYKADSNMMKILLVVLNRVKVKRAVAKVNSGEITEQLHKSGIKVQAFNDNQLLTSFVSGGNLNETQTYFQLPEADDPFVVSIPGYNSYLAGFFSMKENEWRDRVIFQTRWQALKRLKVIYPNKPENDFEITANDRFYQLEGLAQFDTTAMMSYIDFFQYFPAEQLLNSGENPRYDSLSRTLPHFIIQLEDIQSNHDNVLKVFPQLEGDRNVLGTSKEGQLVLIKDALLQGLVKKRSDFVQK
ncbi:hypothetical protein [Xanthovirga aplysinae]|uniref:hypothetical protein n=1 Tax=Xanthovirga aplysinae TaxID=2529853 RepID=UPI0012BD1DFB|nr:hypothetical protein [Xanthovirga aplysinae]MTI33614.1 hypothetical protein [Xanthovirga aplysinae]